MRQAEVKSFINLIKKINDQVKCKEDHLKSVKKHCSTEIREDYSQQYNKQTGKMDVYIKKTSFSKRKYMKKAEGENIGIFFTEDVIYNGENKSNKKKLYQIYQDSMEAKKIENSLSQKSPVNFSLHSRKDKERKNKFNTQAYENFVSQQAKESSKGIFFLNKKRSLIDDNNGHRKVKVLRSMREIIKESQKQRQENFINNQKKESFDKKIREIKLQYRPFLSVKKYRAQLAFPEFQIFLQNEKKQKERRDKQQINNKNKLQLITRHINRSILQKLSQKRSSKRWKNTKQISKSNPFSNLQGWQYTQQLQNQQQL